MIMIMMMILEYTILYQACNRTISQMSRVFANGSRDWVSIPGRDIPKTEKMVLDAALLNTQR